ncbi:uncharacterized protein LOC111631193 [Centruroides sculpturatus]|uniref:uncharacterized protein LOC111631193 n=1 Tax=Centruroides sculpturatus TaxID=218467 RepID=UPI000C6D1806|nr:uncharacterized protein LOC111631193 [Centruroides sculpturatus]XP_023231163.1 uncharacterized protein LOC111631193 [Centruroides sculpturatus]XP_023231164.1 uncharacterized protein LOC111631193 [Centruroides sculpturatus]
MSLPNCDKEIEVDNSNERVSCVSKEVTLEDSVSVIVHIILDLAARKRREEAKSSSSDSDEKLGVDPESLALSEEMVALDKEKIKNKEILKKNNKLRESIQLKVTENADNIE